MKKASDEKENRTNPPTIMEPSRKVSNLVPSGKSKQARSSTTALAMCLLLSANAAALANPIDFIKIQWPCVYVQGTAHGPATNTPDIHGLIPPAPPWSTPFIIGEQGPGYFILRGTNAHLVKCDALDSPMGAPYPYSTAVSVGYGQGIVEKRFGAAVPHPPHQDAYVVAFAAFSIVRSVLGFEFETRGHVHGSLGVHRPMQSPGGGGAEVHGLAAILSGQSATPANDSAGVGCLVMIADLASSTIGLQLNVQGITPDQIMAASIQLGPQGPAIFTLGLWDTFDFDQGCRCSMPEAPFPGQYLQALLAGQCYVNLSTQNYPHGELGAQISPVPLSVRLEAPVLSGGKARLDFYVESGFPQVLQLQMAPAANGPWQDTGVSPQLVGTNHYQATVPANRESLFFRVQAR